MTTKEFAIAFATKLVSDYPQAVTVVQIMDLAIAEGRFENADEMRAVWGRLMRMKANHGKVSA